MNTDKLERYTKYLRNPLGLRFRALVDAGIDDIRTLNCAVNNGIEKIEDFTQLTERDLLKWPNFGRRSLQIVQDALGAQGLTLNEGHENDDLLKSLIAMANETRAKLREAGDNHKTALAAVDLRRKQVAA